MSDRTDEPTSLPPEANPSPRKGSKLTFSALIMLIAVVSILLGLMLPALHRAREKARRAQCGNHLKSIGFSMRLYSGDNKEHYPTDKTWTTIGSFALLTNNYMTAYKCWLCPSDRGVVAGSPMTPWTKTNLSYAYGGFGLKETTEPDTPLMCDRSSMGDPIGPTPWSGNRWTHRSDGGNVLYADGHVAFARTMNPPMYRGKNP